MDDWQKDWWKHIENTTETVENFFHDVDRAIESFSAEVIEVVEDVSEQLQNTVNTEIERFVKDFKDFELYVDRVTETAEFDLENEFDLFWEEVANSIKDFVDFDEETETGFNIWEDIENFVNDPEFVEITTETPSQDNHPACINCNNYHGQAYNGQILVCAMHPHGVEDDSCPDWEESTLNYHDFF